MANQVGIGKSEVSRETIEAGTRVLQALAERDLSELDVLVVYLDGIVFRELPRAGAVDAQTACPQRPQALISSCYQPGGGGIFDDRRWGKFE